MKLDREYIRLIKNIAIMVGIGILIYILYDYFFGGTENNSSKIADTPIHIESVKRIAEVSAVSYTDEIVVDSVEYYEEIDLSEDWLDAIKMTERLLYRNVKRRLTIIVKGEVRYGFDLQRNNFSVKKSNDSLILYLPEPEIIEINVSPSGNEIYQEQGNWSDSEIKKLENRAKKKLVENVETLDLNTKARESASKLFKRLLQHEKHVEIKYDTIN